MRVDGTFASRRHAELWLESGAWWVADAGSTNGIRVESAEGDARPRGALPRRRARAGDRARAGLRVVLSARADGPPADYPWVALRAATSRTGGSAGNGNHDGDATTPVVVPLAAARARRDAAHCRAHGAGGDRFEITHAARPERASTTIRRASCRSRIGRSRSQTLVIDWSHEGVSGHHVDVDGLDDSRARRSPRRQRHRRSTARRTRRRALPLAARRDDGARRRVCRASRACTLTLARRGDD